MPSLSENQPTTSHHFLPVKQLSYMKMVQAAIEAHKDIKGVTRQAILKYVMANYGIKVNQTVASRHVNKTLKAAMEEGTIVNTKGVISVSGRFKMAKQPGQTKPKTKAKPSTAAAKSRKRIASARSLVHRSPRTLALAAKLKRRSITAAAAVSSPKFVLNQTFDMLRIILPSSSTDSDECLPAVEVNVQQHKKKIQTKQVAKIDKDSSGVTTNEDEPKKKYKPGPKSSKQRSQSSQKGSKTSKTVNSGTKKSEGHVHTTGVTDAQPTNNGNAIASTSKSTALAKNTTKAATVKRAAKK